MSIRKKYIKLVSMTSPAGIGPVIEDSVKAVGFIKKGVTRSPCGETCFLGARMNGIADIGFLAGNIDVMHFPGFLVKFSFTFGGIRTWIMASDIILKHSILRIVVIPEPQVRRTCRTGENAAAGT